MKKILLVMSVIAVLFMAGCQNNDSENNNVPQNEVNQGQEEIENSEEKMVLNVDSETTILNNESDEVMNSLAHNPNIIGNIKDSNGEIYNVISYEEYGYSAASNQDSLVLIVNKENKVVYYFEKNNQSYIALKSTGEVLSNLKVENNIITYYELCHEDENSAATIKNEIEIIGFGENSDIIAKEHRKIPMYNWNEIDVAGAT